MKRVKAACICQTLHFMRKDDRKPDIARRRVREEVPQSDGSVVIKVIRQYNQCPVEDYLK